MRILFAVSLAALLAQGADPARAGMDPAALQRMSARLKEFVDQGYIPGAVTLIQRKGVTAQLEAYGVQDTATRAPMKADSLFQIMSMTKPVTGTAIMLLVEEGKIRLTDPVEKHLPEFAGQWLLVSQTAGERVLRRPSRAITIRDLMTHTSGMPGGPSSGAGNLMVTMDRTLAEAVHLYSQQPLEFEPGTKWMYSNTGIATLGRIVEVVSGQPYEKFLAERVFQPLGMKDSHIFLPAEKRARVAMLYTYKDGKLAPADATNLAGDAWKFRAGSKYSGPEHALYSTAQDLANFYQMMLDKGVFQGKRILSAASVELMSSPQTGDINPAGWLPAACFGLTFEVTCRPAGTTLYLSQGAFHHGGAFGTFGWIDPKRQTVGVFLIQMTGADRSDVRGTVLELAASAVVE
jgi:CubicO group peptidase (beta-lactamase class C family)